MKRIYKYIFLALLLYSCKNEKISTNQQLILLSDASLFTSTLEELTDIIVHDIFSPPVASRVYVYPCIAAYEAIAIQSEEHISLAGQITHLSSIPKPNSKEQLSFELAALRAFKETAKALIFSKEKLEIYEEQFQTKLDSLNISKKLIADSYAYGDLVASHILKWVNEDNYLETRSDPKYNVTDQASEWKPTPPAYMEAIEPHWSEIRPLIIKDLSHFQPNGPTPFNLDPNSQFYKEILEVKEAVDKANDEQKVIASFWDCNPYALHQTGHVMFAAKKITPGGHWMGIASVACRTKNLDFNNTVEAHVWTSLALFDSFISCWDEKYRSKLIRPETLINEYIDPEWIPLLQTPPFPEHTSGHSVISSAAAMVLTHVLGENFKYTDDVEVKYGLPERDFTSFNQAAEEAAISRLYGGIHYMPAITEGVKQGRSIGYFLISNLSTRSN